MPTTRVEEMPLRFNAVISAEDWIRVMVLYILAVQFVGALVDDVGETSSKGITVSPSTTHPGKLANRPHSRSSVSLDLRLLSVRLIKDILCEHW